MLSGSDDLMALYKHWRRENTFLTTTPNLKTDRAAPVSQKILVGENFLSWHSWHPPALAQYLRLTSMQGWKSVGSALSLTDRASSSATARARFMLCLRGYCGSYGEYHNVQNLYCHGEKWPSNNSSGSGPYTSCHRHINDVVSSLRSINWNLALNYPCFWVAASCRKQSSQVTFITNLTQ